MMYKCDEERAMTLDLVNGLHRIPMHKIRFLQANVSAKFKNGSSLEECVCQIDSGEPDPSTHPNFVLHLARPGRISCPRNARSPQRVARDTTKSHSRLHFAPSTRTISAEGCDGPGQIALSPAFRARRGLRFVVLRRCCPALREKVKKSER